MDSVTQVVLGAAVGEAVLGRRVGIKAAIWGGVAGTLPDLDVVVYPFIDEVAKLGWHRGPSHAFFFQVLAAPLLAWLIWRLHGREATWRQWTILVYLGFVTHVLLDLFTVYGTQIFRPFSDLPVAFNTISIIDPLYTVPLLIGLIVALRSKRRSSRRKNAVWAGLAISTVYLFLTVGIKSHVATVTEQALDRNEIAYERYMTAPTMFNSILWQITVDADSGFFVSSYSLLDDDEELGFDFVPQRDSLLEPYEASLAVERLRWFSRGYYAVTDPDSRTLFHDLRFGELGIQPDSSYQYVFTWLLEDPQPNGGEVIIEREEIVGEFPMQAIEKLLQRMMGD